MITRAATADEAAMKDPLAEAFEPVAETIAAWASTTALNHTPTRLVSRFYGEIPRGFRYNGAF